MNWGVEYYERRLLLATWEGIGTYTFQNDTPAKPIGNVASGQRIKLSALFIDDHPASLQTATVYYQGRQLYLDSLNNSKEITFDAGGSYFWIDADINDESNDQVRISLAKERLPDIVPVRVGLHHDNRTVNFDIEVRNEALPTGVKVPVKYYWVDEGNVGQEIVLSETEPAKYLSNVGKDKQATLAVPYKYFSNNPDWASRVRVLVNPDKTVRESNYSNAIDFLPANIVPLAPRLNKLRQFEIGYRVKNEHFFIAEDERKDDAPTVQAWWSKDGTWEKRISIDGGPVFRVAMHPQKGEDIYVQPSAADLDKLKNPPAGAKYLITRVDNLNLVPESNEKDNVSAAFALFDANVKSLTWDGNGGAKFTVTLANRNNLPAGSNLRVEFYWSKDGTLAGKMPGDPVYAFPISRGSRTYRDGDNSWTVDKKYLPTPTPREIIRFGNTVTHLVAVLKHDSFPATAASRSSERKLVLPLVSLELSDAPAASTDRERVGLWLKEHATEIKAAAKQYRIDPLAIAGIIAWEAHAAPGRTIPILGIEWIPAKRTVEHYLGNLGGFSRAANGPGKVHFNPDNTLANLPGEPHPTVVEEVEWLALVPVQATTEDRRAALENPRTGITNSIEYIAAIMGAYADAFQQIHPGQPIRNRPSVLATLYNGVDAWPNLTTVFDRLPDLPEDYRPEPGKRPYAGWWINQRRNLNFLTSAIGSGTRIPTTRPVTYVPKQIDAPTQFNNPVTELSWALADLAAGATRVKGFYARSADGDAAEGVVSIRGDRLVYTLPQSGLPTGTIYYSVDDGNRIIYGGRITMRIDVPEPTVLGATSDAPSRVRLSWTLRGSADGFQVERRFGTQEWQRVATVSGIGRDWVGTDHAADTDYVYQVRAVSRTGLVSPASSPVRVRTLRGTTDAPTNLQVVSVDPRNVSVRWDEVSGEDHYAVEVSTDGGKSWQLQENVPADHAYNANLSVQPGKSYEFRVVAVYNDGRSTPSNNVSVSTPDDAPGAPSGLRAENIWARAVDFRWRAASGKVFEYRIAFSRDGVNWDNVGIVGADATSFRLTGLTPNTRVIVRVRASGPGGYSEYSNTIEFRTRT